MCSGNKAAGKVSPTPRPNQAGPGLLPSITLYEIDPPHPGPVPRDGPGHRQPHAQTAEIPAAAPAAPKTQKEKLSYAIGMDIGQTFKKQNFDIDPAFLSAAIRDSLTGAAPS